jgi:hypothetical protein
MPPRYSPLKSNDSSADLRIQLDKLYFRAKQLKQEIELFNYMITKQHALQVVIDNLIDTVCIQCLFGTFD